MAFEARLHEQVAGRAMCMPLLAVLLSAPHCETMLRFGIIKAEQPGAEGMRWSV